MLSLCVRLCGVNVAYQKRSDYTVVTVQLMHAAGESILWHVDWRHDSYQMTLGRTCIITNKNINMNSVLISDTQCSMSKIVELNEFYIITKKPFMHTKHLITNRTYIPAMV